MDSLVSRYAKALLSIAVEEENVAYYKEEIKMLKDVFNDNKDIMHLLLSYFLSDKEREKIVDDIYPNNENIRNFIKIILKNRRGNYLIKIFEEFIIEANEILGIKEGIIYSVNQLNADQIAKIEDAVGTRLNHKVELTNKIDEKLVGGIRVVIEDKVFDASIKNKLERMKENLIKGGY